MDSTLDPAVSTDLLDYAPGDTATITAENFIIGSTLEFEVEHLDAGADGVYGTADDTVIDTGGDGHDSWTVTDGGEGDLDGEANGTIVTEWYVNPDDSAGASFLLTATDAESGDSASTQFTDAPPPPPPSAVPVEADPAQLDNGLLFSAEGTEAGTGNFPAFVKIQGDKEDGGSNYDDDGTSATEEGFNTSWRDPGNPESPVLDTDNEITHNHSIQLWDVLTATIDGVAYREFHLDLNESNQDGGDDSAAAWINLDALKLYWSENGELSTLAGATEIYNMDGGADGRTGGGDDANVSILLNAWAPGSGFYDYKVFIPESYFSGLAGDSFIYLYSAFSDADSGFEEWGGAQANGGPMPAIDIDKVTGDGPGGDIEDGDGVEFAIGDTVTWTYTVVNAGNVALSNVTVTDDAGTPGDPDDDFVAVYQSGDTDGDGKLDVNETWIFTATGIAQDTSGFDGGQYHNFGAVTGEYDGEEVGNADDSSYETPFRPQGALTIDKVTADLGDDDQVDGTPGDGNTILTGENIEWRYTVTNIGNVSLVGIVVTDDNGTPDDDSDDFEVGTIGFLGVGESATLTLAGLAGAGLYENVATASGADAFGNPVPEASDPSSYFGADPGISITKYIVCDEDGTLLDANEPVNLFVGDGEVTYRIVVKNTGNVDLTGVTLSDDGFDLNGDEEGSDLTLALLAGQEYSLTLTADWAAGGPTTNTATVTASYADDAGHTWQAGDGAGLSDSAIYFGLDPHITLSKLTNGVDGPDLLQGQAITWSYLVENDGNVDLTNIEVWDDNGTAGDTSDDILVGTLASLAAGHSDTLYLAGFAAVGAYANLGTATADEISDACGDSVTPQATDASSYTGHARAPEGLTKGYWSTHLTEWDAKVGDEQGGKAEINPYPQFDWNHSGGISLSAVVSGGPASGRGMVSGANNGNGDSGLLMGDLNHNGQADDDENLFFDLASAQLLANSSVSGDARIILASQAVAAQLNEYANYLYDQAHGGLAAGYTASPNGLIEEAVRWLEGGGLLGNASSAVNSSVANDVGGVTTIINDAAGLDYTISGNSLVFKSAPLSSSNEAWSGEDPWTEVLQWTDNASLDLDNDGIYGEAHSVRATGEGLKNALAAYNHGLSGGTQGFVMATDGSLIGWEDGIGGTPKDVIENDPGAFWAILAHQDVAGVDHVDIV